MCTEIETKLKVDSHEQIIKALEKIGAEFLAECTQIDYYFDGNPTFAVTGRCLRLRRQRTGKNEKVFLTYKGTQEEHTFKKRQEIELEVADADSAEKLLLALGYKKEQIVEKKRRLWRLNDCEIALDELPLLGSFVEIEGPDDKKIADVQRNLGLADLPHIKESYAALVEKKLKKNCQSEIGS